MTYTNTYEFSKTNFRKQKRYLKTVKCINLAVGR